MPNVAEVEGVTGPGREVKLALNEVESVKFNFGHSTLEIEQKNGQVSVFDMAESGVITTTNEVDKFLIQVKRKTQEKDEKADKVIKTDQGPVQVKNKDASEAVPHKADIPPAKKS